MNDQPNGTPNGPPPYRRPHVKLQSRPVQVRQPVGRFVSGQLERHKTKRAAGSRARVAVRRKTVGP